MRFLLQDAHRAQTVRRQHIKHRRKKTEKTVQDMEWPEAMKWKRRVHAYVWTHVDTYILVHTDAYSHLSRLAKQAEMTQWDHNGPVPQRCRLGKAALTQGKGQGRYGMEAGLQPAIPSPTLSITRNSAPFQILATSLQECSRHICLVPVVALRNAHKVQSTGGVIWVIGVGREGEVPEGGGGLRGAGGVGSGWTLSPPQWCTAQRAR